MRAIIVLSMLFGLVLPANADTATKPEAKEADKGTSAPVAAAPKKEPAPAADPKQQPAQPTQPAPAAPAKAH